MSKIKYCWNCKTEVSYQEYNKIDFIPKCKKCGVSYPEKPKDEAYLSIYQDEYLKDRSEKNFNKLFNLLNKITFNIIKHKLKKKSSYEDLDDIYDKVQWTLEKLTKYYKEKPDFKITTSFIQYIGQLVLYPLYNKDEQEKNKKELSLYTPIFTNSKDKNTKELNDYLSKEDDGNTINVENKINYDMNKNNIVKESLSFLSQVLTSLYEYEKEHNNNGFKSCYYMLLLYKFFINNDKSKVIDEITNSMDYNLVKKFDNSKELYKNILLGYTDGQY